MLQSGLTMVACICPGVAQDLSKDFHTWAVYSGQLSTPEPKHVLAHP